MTKYFLKKLQITLVRIRINECPCHPCELWERLIFVLPSPFGEAGGGVGDSKHCFYNKFASEFSVKGLVSQQIR